MISDVCRHFQMLSFSEEDFSSAEVDFSGLRFSL